MAFKKLKGEIIDQKEVVYILISENVCRLLWQRDLECSFLNFKSPLPCQSEVPVIKMRCIGTRGIG